MTRRKRILIVDDDEAGRELLIAMMEAIGYRCEGAADGFDALTKLKNGYDLVLLDLMMPGIDGFQVLAQICASSPGAHAPVVIVTALGEHEIRTRARAAGATAFLAKPVHWTELRVCAEKHLAPA